MSDVAIIAISAAASVAVDLTLGEVIRERYHRRRDRKR